MNDFARYIGVYCNKIEFGEFTDLDEFNITEDSAIYYFEDNNKKLHRYIKKPKNDIAVDDSDSSDINSEYDVTIDGKDIALFDKELISGFEKERVTGYAEPLNIYEGFINRAQYGFEILKPFEPGDWIGIGYKEIDYDSDGNINDINHHFECYFADDKTKNNGEKIPTKQALARLVTAEISITLDSFLIVAAEIMRL